ncbi:MAG: hypothetical protein ACUVT6_10465 [Thermodesulfobacteriota bacterium]
MLEREGKYISYEKWTELMSRNTFIFEEEKHKETNRLLDMYSEDIDEEEA